MVDYIWVVKFHSIILLFNIQCLTMVQHVKASKPVFWHWFDFQARKLVLSFSLTHTQPEYFHSSAICHFLLPWLQWKTRALRILEMEEKQHMVHYRHKHPHMLQHHRTSRLCWFLNACSHPFTHTILSQLKSSHLINISSWHRSSLHTH